jgi:hypothetical protein
VVVSKETRNFAGKEMEVTKTYVEAGGSFSFTTRNRPTLNLHLVLRRASALAFSIHTEGK